MAAIDSCFFVSSFRKLQQGIGWLRVRLKCLTSAIYLPKLTVLLTLSAISLIFAH